MIIDACGGPITYPKLKYIRNESRKVTQNENNEEKHYFLNRLRSNKSTPEKVYFVHVDLSKI
jgi:hypothetical protein